MTLNELYVAQAFLLGQRAGDLCAAFSGYSGSARRDIQVMGKVLEYQKIV